MSEKLDGLRAKFTEITGKQPFLGWDESKLEEVIKSKENAGASEIEQMSKEVNPQGIKPKDTPPVEQPKDEEEEQEKPKEEEKPKEKERIKEPELSEFEKLPEKERMEEAKKINTMQYKLIPEDLTPVFLGGDPFIVIGNEYVPYDKGVIIIQERKVDLETEKLEELKKKFTN